MFISINTGDTMALSDFLGQTSEIKIIDFLAENPDMEYNLTELSEYIGISRATLYEKLPKLIHNKIVEISAVRGRMKYFRLADNKITEHLIKAVFAHSFMMAEEERDEEEALKEIKLKIKEEIGKTTEQEEKSVLASAHLSSSVEPTFTFPRLSSESQSQKQHIKISLSI